MMVFVCLFVVLCFVNTVTTQDQVTDIRLIAIVAVIPTIICIANVFVMAAVIISGIYKMHKTTADVELATNPNLKDKDLERSIVLENTHNNPTAPPTAPPTQIEAFGTDDTTVHRYEEMSPL